MQICIITRRGQTPDRGAINRGRYRRVANTERIIDALAAVYTDMNDLRLAIDTYENNYI